VWRTPLGWVRENRPLEGDTDVHFFYDVGDEDRFESAIPVIVEGGFERLLPLANNDGVVTEQSFLRHGTSSSSPYLPPPPGGGRSSALLHVLSSAGTSPAVGRDPWPSSDAVQVFLSKMVERRTMRPNSKRCPETGMFRTRPGRTLTSGA
jgi:hypothetical protein